MRCMAWGHLAVMGCRHACTIKLLLCMQRLRSFLCYLLLHNGIMHAATKPVLPRADPVLPLQGKCAATCELGDNLFF